MKKQAIHVIDNYMVNPTNPITVNLIGAGGTGSRVLTALAEISHSLIALGHPGLHVNLYDDDIVTEANMGRQRFAETELGLKKCVARINNINRFFGTNWKARPERFVGIRSGRIKAGALANLYITCVDNVQTRFDFADFLKDIWNYRRYEQNKPLYWMDMGNSRFTGQAVLSTIGEIKQPDSEKYLTVGLLPMVTDEFRDLLLSAEKEDDTPSCSLPEALQKQDLFINPAICYFGCSLLWQMFREGMLLNRGMFLNLKDLRTQPLAIA
jgi:PRTRC genetic system ThiF family protein